MSLPVAITDGKLKASVREVDNGTDARGVVVLVDDLIKWRSKFASFTNADYGAAMNQDGGFGGTPVVIHDGTDSVAWTATDIVGTKMTADSTDRAYAGTKSVKVDGPALNDVWQFDKGSAHALTGYTAITMWISVDRRWDAGEAVEFYGWDGAQVGTRVNLADYFDALTYDVWHPVVIPLADMGLTAESITGLRMQYSTAVDTPPRFYIDTLRLEETGDPIEFRVKAPTKGKRYKVLSVSVAIADANAGTLADGTMPALAYDKLLALTALTNGITFTHLVDGDVELQGTFHDLGDFLAIGFELSSAISDGTNTMIVLDFRPLEPMYISGPPDENNISITVRDDMTGLLKFTGQIRGAVER